MDGVYVTDAGALTLTLTPLKVGVVIDLNANGTIYLDIDAYCRKDYNISEVDTLVEMEALSGEVGDMCFCRANLTWYQLSISVGTLEDDNKFFTASGKGAPWSWNSVGGQYTGSHGYHHGDLGGIRDIERVVPTASVAQFKVVKVIGGGGDHNEQSVNVMTLDTDTPAGICFNALTVSVKDWI